MGLELCFRYEVEDKSPFTESEHVVYLGELFEVPDFWIKVKVFESFEAMKVSGLLPPFVVQYRKEAGSQMGYFLNITEEQRAADSTAWLAELEDGLDEDFFISTLASADDVHRWATVWLALLERAVTENPKLLTVYLPVGHENYSDVLQDLRLVLNQANEAVVMGVAMRLEAWID